MTTFQAIIYGAIQGFSDFLPISPQAHNILVPYLLDWPHPTGAFLGIVSLGNFLALLVYFRHDWAAMISSFLQILIYRKRPMTMDERMPFFILLASIPIAGAWYYMQGSELLEMNLYWTAGIFVATGVLLWMVDYLSRKSKNIFDWNWRDSLVAGILQT